MIKARQAVDEQRQLLGRSDAGKRNRVHLLPGHRITPVYPRACRDRRQNWRAGSCGDPDMQNGASVVCGFSQAGMIARGQDSLLTSILFIREGQNGQKQERRTGGPYSSCCLWSGCASLMNPTGGVILAPGFVGDP